MILTHIDLNNFRSLQLPKAVEDIVAGDMVGVKYETDGEITVRKYRTYYDGFLGYALIAARPGQGVIIRLPEEGEETEIFVVETIPPATADTEV